MRACLPHGGKLSVLHPPCDGVPTEPKACRVHGQNNGRGAGVARPPDAAGAVKGGRQQGIWVGGVEVHKSGGAAVAHQHRHWQARPAAADLQSAQGGCTGGHI